MSPERAPLAGLLQDIGVLPRIDEVPAFAKFSLGGLFPDSSLELLHDEEAAVKDVMRVLGAEQ